MSNYTLLKINNEWFRAEVFPGGGICTSERFGGLAQAIRFIRNYRNFGYCMNDTMRYW